MLVLAPLLVGSHLLLVADLVPVFDVKKICQGREIEAVFAGRNAESCIQSEEATRDQLKKSWGEFSAKDEGQGGVCCHSQDWRQSQLYRTHHLSRNQPRPG